MRRDPFDERCCCDHETETHECMCLRKTWQCKDRCARCLEGKHALRRKGRKPSASEAGQILSILDRTGACDD
jgi:hypothetical protein